MKHIDYTVHQMPATNLDEVVKRAVRLAEGIVEPHLFKDGNGRAPCRSPLRADWPDTPY